MKAWKGARIYWNSPLFGECSGIVSDVGKAGEAYLDVHPITDQPAVIMPEWIVEVRQGKNA